jgi:hypothetical protein
LLLLLLPLWLLRSLCRLVASMLLLLGQSLLLSLLRLLLLLCLRLLLPSLRLLLSGRYRNSLPRRLLCGRLAPSSCRCLPHLRSSGGDIATCGAPGLSCGTVQRYRARWQRLAGAQAPHAAVAVGAVE